MAVLSLPSDIKENGINQGSLHTLLTNFVTVINELVDDHATYKTVVDDLKTQSNKMRNLAMNKAITPANFEISSNFDIQNGDSFYVISDGNLRLISTDQVFDTGTATVISTNGYWAGAVLSTDGESATPTTYVDWGAEAADESTAANNLFSVTPSGSVVCGYVTVQAAAGQDFVAGTDALFGGTGGQVAQATNYSNFINTGVTVLPAAVSSSTPAALTNSTDLTLNKG